MHTECEDSVLQEAGELLRNGKLVVFPTETVYGLGANALDTIAIKKIFEAKGRPSDNPLIAHIDGLAMLDMLVADIGNVERKLMNAFWPGPLTIIFDKLNKVPPALTGGTNKIAIRMPSNVIAKKLIAYANVPIAAPSANKSGKPSGTVINDIYDELKNDVVLFLDAGRSQIGVESTVVKVENGVPIVLRPGGITPDNIADVIGCVKLDKSIFDKIDANAPVLSPGMKYRHYAPDCDCVLVDGNSNESKASKVVNIIKQHNPDKIVVICTNENVKIYLQHPNVEVLSMGDACNFKEVSQNLYSLLRNAETFNPKLVIMESVRKEGLGLALMNRMIRACGYNVVDSSEH